jgi:hypothetical protein
VELPFEPGENDEDALVIYYYYFCFNSSMNRDSVSPENLSSNYLATRNP